MSKGQSPESIERSAPIGFGTNVAGDQLVGQCAVVLKQASAENDIGPETAKLIKGRGRSCRREA